MSDLEHTETTKVPFSNIKKMCLLAYDTGALSTLMFPFLIFGEK